MTVVSLILLILNIYGYFRYGSVYLAFSKLKKNELSEALEILNSIKNVRMLNNSNKAYYYFMKGHFSLEDNKDKEALEFFLIADKLGLRTSNDKSILKLGISKCFLNLKDIENAKKNIIEGEKFISNKDVGSEYSKLKILIEDIE